MNARHHALILIFVILFSMYAFKKGDAFLSTSSEAQRNVAQVISSISLVNDDSLRSPVSEVRTSQSDEVAQPVADTQSTNVASNAFHEKPTVSNDESKCSVSARIYLVQNISNGSVIMENDSFNRWPIASITKLMSAIVAWDLLDHTTNVTVTKEAQSDTGGYTTLKEGEIYSVEDLVKAMLVFSSNDAAYSLSRVVGTEKFVAAMNDKARSIGMDQTSFFEPSGLSYLNQSTAHDLYLLMKYIHTSYPELLTITTKKTVSLYDSAHKIKRTFTNIDAFAGTATFKGGKTGYIDQSGENLVTLFDRGGQLISIVVLSSPDRFSETQKLLQCSASAL